MQEQIRELLTALEPVLEQHMVAGALVLIGAAAMSAMAAFVSIAVLVAVAVFVWGEMSTMLMLWIGWILGGVLAYGLAWHLGRRVIRWIGARTLLERCESWVAADTPFILILLLQLALPSEIPGYLLGLVRYPPHKYIVALALAELPYAWATVYLGNAFLEGRSDVILGMGAIAVVLSVLAALPAAHEARGHASRCMSWFFRCCRIAAQCQHLPHAIPRRHDASIRHDRE